MRYNPKGGSRVTIFCIFILFPSYPSLNCQIGQNVELASPPEAHVSNGEEAGKPADETFTVASVLSPTSADLRSNDLRAYQSSILSPRPSSCNNKGRTLDECLFLTGGGCCASSYIRSQRMRTYLLLLIIHYSAA